ncbi:patatin family protein [Collinsella sp. An2]|uniref:patatin-like phospholipase family protein n=1 Tax=Collinsella sp. An2 TaxID=1965585 RepID=UPI000B37C4CA|nr:patatin family protein [Collinsella sp. An2]OUP10922.1 patatin family protein [Collinsella sp. An2]
MENSVQTQVDNHDKVALILEGGSFRCQFSAGVTDVMLEHGLNFDACYGVSAGALTGLSFKSRQIGRVNRVNLTFCGDSRYMGAEAVATSGSLVGYDFMLNDVQDRLDPFDNDTFTANPLRLFATATDIVFGTPDYLEVKNATLDIDAVRASTSMPLVTPPVEIDGHFYLDGGVADSVPVEHVLEDEGYGRAIVVLTQDRSYQKGPYELMGAARARYAKYPYLLDALESRHERYNEQREHIWEYERAGRIMVIAPPRPVEVGHMERDREKLLALYIQGRQEMVRALDGVRAFAAKA